ncbi:hypothetical protein JMJ35_002109 [Cladonia borealis]|uniref:Uncharacterized protein n=1 Tax=Cladonia borealis TaxID=184061 RepID=A0AA39V9N7_9LECA|nr:hypothetical protein JMJ35_002109 [Cladonia borealis]
MGILSLLDAVPRKWRTPKLLLAMFIIEIPFCIAALALFGISQPDLYRTQFWQFGSDMGWNSNPNQLIYAYANYKPINAPLPWSQFTTNFNVVIAVLAVFILLCKAIMYITGVFHPLVSMFAHSGLLAIWAVAIHNQAGPDMSDPTHPQPGAPWYITKPCKAPVRPGLIGYCKQAKAAFAVTIILTTLYFVYIVVTLITLYPDRSFRAARSTKLSDNESQAPWEMMLAPQTPGTTGGLKSPTTPRTMAFNTLSGHGKPPVRQGNKGIPLRHHIAMGEETYAGSSRR